MESRTGRRWRFDHRLALELFALANIGLLSADIYLAHSVNRFAEPAEYLPLYFSLAAPVVLVVALWAGWRREKWALWRWLGLVVGWLSIAVGLGGTVLHLESRFFYEQTIKSLVYAAPFAAPLAYTGLGMLLVMNRMVDDRSVEWAYWVLLLALGGFFGNFVFSLTDHAQNGFFHATEWIPVVSAALAVGFLTAPFVTPVGKGYCALSGGVLLGQVAVGVAGFVLHNQANLSGPAHRWWESIVHGAPALAPLLFADLALLAALGLWVLAAHLDE